MAERQIEELRGQKRTMQDQVENSLTQSNEKMSKILQEARNFEA